jgi:hypothetical protein
MLLLAGREGATPRDPDVEAHDGPLSEHEGYRAEIDQATGMITVQLDTGIDDAFARLRAHAYAQDRSLSDVALDVVTRRLRFSPDPSGGPTPSGPPGDGEDS